MKLKIKLLYVLLVLLSTTICQAQNEFSNVPDFNEIFLNPASATTSSVNMPTLTDFDLDGHLDLIVSNFNTQKIWKGSMGLKWSNIATVIDNQISDIPLGACVWADLNNDALLDLIVTPVYSSELTILLQTSATSNAIYFTDISNVVNTHIRNRTRITYDETRVAVGHFNNDDKLDLLISLYGNKNADLEDEVALWPFVLIQEEGMTFSRINISEKFISMGAKLCDYDRDGDLDAYIGSYRETENRLLNWDYNEETKTGSFSKVRHNTSYLNKGHSNGGVKWAHCTGMEWIDYDNDGDFDLFVSNLKHGGVNSGISELFENKNGKFQLTFKRHGFEPYGLNTWHHAQQTVSFDIDNDGDVDIVQPRTAQGNCALKFYGYTSQLYINDIENEYFNPVTLVSDIYNDNWGMVAGDCNNDGDIDLFTAANYGWGCYTEEDENGVETEHCFTCHNSETSDIKYFRNRLNYNNDNSNQFVKLRLEGDQLSNKLTAGIGAEIYIDNNDGGIMSRLIEISVTGQKTGTGYTKQFGLGNWDSETTNIYVKWINTPVNKVEKFQLTTADINNRYAPYIITKNSGILVDRVFYCEEDKALNVTTEINSSYSKKSFFEVSINSDESVVGWELQSIRNDRESKFSGNWTVISSSGNANPFRWNYLNNYDIKARALIKHTSGKRCYSEVAYGYGNTNIGEDKLISEQASLNTSLIKVSPNPATSLITVKLNLAETAGELANKIALYNSNGAIVYSKNLDDYSAQTHQISIADFSPGIYFVTVQTPNTVESVKVIKQ